jgi:hypothetical protein
VGTATRITNIQGVGNGLNSMLTRTMEYMLTSDKPSLVVTLKNRLKNVTPDVFGKVSKPLKNATFIIHETAEVSGKVESQVESIITA